MSLIETHELSIYYERSSKQSNGPLLYIGGTGGDLRNKPNQLDSPLKDSSASNLSEKQKEKVINSQVKIHLFV